jgi:D-serine deaminase-like pyridoxal phosphate-dependent protein
MPRLTRRTLLAGGAAISAAGLVMARPGDESGPRDPYFLNIQAALTRAGIATPTLVIDRTRMNANIDLLKSHLPQGMHYRIVAKSLPSLDLIQHIRKRAGTDRLMTFNLPMLLALADAMPEASQLLGKPLPVAAARRYFEVRKQASAVADGNIQWLIDTPERLAQYTALAQAVGQKLQVNFELDVGLHRGGFVPGEALGAALQAAKASPHVVFSGFMGYEPHLASVPAILGWRERALKEAWRTYRAALEQAGTVFPAGTMASLTRNAAGSPTYRYYQTTDIANEISAGSCLVKPSDFDTDLLSQHRPASFIAAPVIKSLGVTRIPGLEPAYGAIRAWDPNVRQTVFIYGGHWLAEPVDPPGLRYNKVFGRSSNQEMFNGGARLDIRPDEFVFLRPHQSEAVFLQFGDIAIYEGGEIKAFWPVFEASA